MNELNTVYKEKVYTKENNIQKLGYCYEQQI